MIYQTNKTIKELISLIADPQVWYKKGRNRINTEKPSYCIITGLLYINNNYNSIVLYNSAKQINKAIRTLYPQCIQTNLSSNTLAIDLARFNDHPDVEHSDILAVLNLAEKRSRPFYKRFFNLN